MSLFLSFQLLFHESSVHFLEAISSETDIDVHRDGNIGVAEESGEDFDVNALVVAVCSERVSERVGPTVFNASALASLLDVFCQIRIADPHPVAVSKHPGALPST